ncbi:MAG: ROK family transcriptional regulator [Lachnospira sp.]
MVNNNSVTSKLRRNEEFMASSENNTITDVKKINKNRVFRLIYDSLGISRQEISNSLGLSLPTVNQNLRMLIEEKLIEFEGNFKSTGGRKAQIIKVNKNAKVAFGANITAEYVRTILMDFNGNIVDNIQDNYSSADYLLAGSIIQSQIIKLIDKHGISLESVLGVGITVPGIFNGDQTVIVAAPTMNIKDISVKSITEKITFPVNVVNDARAGAFADYWFNNMSGREEDKYNDAIYIMLNDGVGGAYIRNGRIESGLHNRCGEFGHITIHPGGKPCMCGRKGCFESYVSQRVLTEGTGISLDEFFLRLKMNDERIAGIFEKYLNDLTIGINNLYIMNDSNIIIGGPLAMYLKPYEDRIREHFKHACPFDADESNVKVSSCDTYQSGAGAGLMHIADYIESI